MVEVTPEALINRLTRGVVYAPDKAARALENFFKEQTLTALRELALRQAAHEVDVRLKRTGPQNASLYMLLHGHITQPATACLASADPPLPSHLRRRFLSF